METPTIGGKAPVRYGYARVSTDDQNLNLQLDALNAAGVTHILTDKLSGKSRKRPGLEDLLSQIGPNDTLVVWRLASLIHEGAFAGYPAPAVPLAA